MSTQWMAAGLSRSSTDSASCRSRAWRWRSSPTSPIIKGVGTLTTDRADLVDDVLATPRNVVWAMVVPLGAAFVFVYSLITYLGWWPAVVHEPKPVQRWVWAVPIIFLVAIALGINYGGLADRGLGFTLLLLLATQFVGWGEEGMFRCISVTTMRRHEWTEGRVALWSSVVFGACTSRTPSTSGTARDRPGRRRQLRRVLLLPDPPRVLGRTSPTRSSTACSTSRSSPVPRSLPRATTPTRRILAILVYVVVAVLLLVRRHHIEID